MSTYADRGRPDIWRPPSPDTAEPLPAPRNHPAYRIHDDTYLEPPEIEGESR